MMRYETYKDTEMDWLGEVPKHWIKHRVDWIGTLIRGNTGFKKDELLDNGEYVALQYGKTYQVDEVNHAFQYFVNSEFYKQNQIVSLGDTILISTSETIEDLGHSCFYNRADLGLIGGEQILFRPIRKLVIGKYLYYYSKKFSTELQKYATGLKVFRFNIDDLKQIFIAIPSLEEQTTIANYLDTKTQTIDKKISLLDKKIGYYQELRKSLINEAVTKGLDKNVKLKESGIDWIGQIPEHWEVKRLKDIAHVNQRNLPENTPSDYSFTYIDIANFDSSGEEIQSIEFKDAPSRARRIIKKGDVIISTVRTYLKAIAVFDFDVSDTIVSTGFAVLTARKLIAPKFLGFLVRAESLVDKVAQLSSGVSYPAINASTLISIEIVIPPQEEQIQIADYLEQKTSTIAKILTNLQTQITTLKELRKTLINDVVTGKIKVIQD